MIPGSFGRHLMVNAGLIWLGLRLGLLFVGVSGWRVAPAVVVLTVVLSVLDVRRRHENVWLEDLGVSRMAVALVSAVPPVAAELVWALVANQ